MKKAILALSTGVVISLWSPPARAHIDLLSPLPRYVCNNAQNPGDACNQQKTGPCSTGTPSGIVTDYVGGDTIVLEWNEFIDHPGHFRIALDTTGTDSFTNPTSEFDKAVAGNVVAFLDDPGNGQAAFDFSLVLPNIDCPNCVLQVMQVMTDKLANGFGGFPANDDIYYWCADLNITRTTDASTTGAGGSGGAGATTATSGGGAGDAMGDESTGGCSITPGTAPATHWALLLAAALLSRRRLQPAKCSV